MKTIITFCGSNSSHSINRQLLQAAVDMVDQERFKVIEVDLRQHDAPIFSVDIERESGHPQSILSLVELLKQGDGFVLSSPEHNGMMTAFLKNILDWLSRVDRKFLGESKPVLLLSTSPGRGGAAKHLPLVARLMEYGGGKLLGTFSLPSFREQFDPETKTIKGELERKELQSRIELLEAELIES